MRRGIAALGLILALASCAAPKPPPDRLVLLPAGFADLRGWSDDHQGEALPALLKSCGTRLKFADTAQVGPNGIAGTVADWRPPCAAAADVDASDDAAARGFFETWFQPYRCTNNAVAEGLFTGYYEAQLTGARARGGAFQTPLRKRPPDLVMVDLADFAGELGDTRPDLKGVRIAGRVANGRLKPYETRAQIEGGALDRQDLALLWVDDPVAAFFLEIQGSGRVTLPDGAVARVGYDGQNGWPYVAIGKVLVDRGLLDRESASMQGIRAWLAAHPDQAKSIMDENRSYVFFRELTGDGPLGSEGVALTPGRSLAVDRKFLPLGAPIWLDAADSANQIRRLLVAQDSGGAIRGPVRGDVFWGHGADAEQRAGGQRARGSDYILLPKTVAVAPTS